jgi:hypothetical protein
MRSVAIDLVEQMTLNKLDSFAGSRRVFFPGEREGVRKDRHHQVSVWEARGERRTITPLPVPTSSGRGFSGRQGRKDIPPAAQSRVAE